MASQNILPTCIALLCGVTSTGAGCAAEPADTARDSTDGRFEAVIGSPIDTMAGIDGSYLRLGLSPRGELTSLRLGEGRNSGGVVDGTYRAAYRCAPTPCVVEGQYHAVPENPAVGFAHIVLTPDDSSGDVDVYIVDRVRRSGFGESTVLSMVLRSAEAPEHDALPFVLFRVTGSLAKISGDADPPADSTARCTEDERMCWMEIPAEPSFDGFVTAYTANAFGDRILAGSWPGLLPGTTRDHRGIITFDTSVLPDDGDIAFAALHFEVLPESCADTCPIGDWMENIVFDALAEGAFGPRSLGSPYLTVADYYAPAAATRPWEPAPMVGFPVLHPSASMPGSSDAFVALIDRDGFTRIRIRTRSPGAPIAIASSEGAARHETMPPTLIVGWTPTEPPLD